MRRTSAFTGGWRWLVPSSASPVRPRAATTSAWTLDGPEPKRPSAGFRSAGISRNAVVTGPDSSTWSVVGPISYVSAHERSLVHRRRRLPGRLRAGGVVAAGPGLGEG